MQTVNLRLELPDTVAEKARIYGLLETAKMRQIIEREIQRRGEELPRVPLTQLIGAGKRHFGSVEEVDRFINAERNSWGSQNE